MAEVKLAENSSMTETLFVHEENNLGFSKEFLTLASQYAMGNTTLFDQESENFKNLFLNYFADTSTGSLREAITLEILGLKKLHTKHGADGYDERTSKYKEVKPKYTKLGEKISRNSGNFNDLTLENLENKKDYDIICSGFNHVKIVYIVEFPMSMIIDHLKVQCEDNKAKNKKRLSENRQASRNVPHIKFTDYDKDGLKVHYFDKEYAYQANCLHRNHLEMLIRRAECTTYPII